MDDKIVDEMRNLLCETVADIVMALDAMHPNIWEDRKTWKEILLDDAKRISELLSRANAKKDGDAK